MKVTIRLKDTGTHPAAIAAWAGLAVESFVSRYADRPAGRAVVYTIGCATVWVHWTGARDVSVTAWRTSPADGANQG